VPTLKWEVPSVPFKPSFLRGEVCPSRLAAIRLNRLQMFPECQILLFLVIFFIVCVESEAEE
jgi:hypothetical protein